MKKLLFTFLFLSLNNYAQITLEKGYFIANNNKKTECLIKNVDWRSNPTKFQYQLSENTELQNKTIKSVKEFGILNNSKYKRYTVQIDRSSNKFNEISTERSPIFVKENLFLKVIVDGTTTLYSYQDGDLKRYFYSKDSSHVEPLVFKKYRTQNNNQIANNEQFKQQLWNNLKCNKITLKEIKNIEYKKTSLVNFFIKFNQCTNSKFTNLEQNKKRNLLNLTIRPGIQNSSFSTNHSPTSFRNINFNNEFGIRLGLEAEYILPFNKNKWSIIIEPTYQSYKTTKEALITKNSTITRKVNVDYQSIELPLGIRHYFFFNNNSKLFFNTSFIFDFPLSSSIYTEKTNLIDLDDIKTGVNFALGMGYNLKNRYSIELRYEFRRDILVNYISWSSDYKSLSLIFGYTIF